MATVQDILRGVLRLIRVSCDAEAISLYARIPTAEGDHPLLIHDGDGPAVPELETVQAAERYAASAATNPAGGGRIAFVPSLSDLLADRLDRMHGAGRRESDGGECSVSTTDSSTPAWLAIRGGADIDPEGLLHSALEGSPHALHLAIGALIGCRTRMVCPAEVDQISQLPTRQAYPATYRRFAAAAGKDHGPGLILVNPDEFNSVNDRFGRDAGDATIREIAVRLREAVRNTDFVFRYGAAMFGVLVPDSTPDIIRAIAEKIRMHANGASYYNGDVDLVFNVGASAADLSMNDDNGVMELAHRADTALGVAKRSGTDEVVLWSPEIRLSEKNRSERLSGIFTADPSRDYRNMRLLWDTIRLIASSSDVETMKDRLLREVVGVFKVAAAGVYDAASSGPAWSIIRRREGSGVDGWDELSDPDPGLRLIQQEVLEGGVTTTRLDEATDNFVCVIPLATDRGTLGCLYLEGSSRLFRLSSGDLEFLEALAGQIGMALDRNRLVAMEMKQHELTRLQLQSELDELHESMSRSTLIFSSEKMDRLLRTAKRMASTDAAVLITGESGTGKEVLARTIHELSPRKKHPLVVVDCGAIATSLIDSELFGHERGAFTGADRRSDGRLLEADGGTVLLDEIGELPLEVQSKLLRFVQEKQFTPVGSGVSRSVDVRVIALTNRDLTTEVQAGRFREDLYHRLNVMRLIVPPLRSRKEDIELLAVHFIRKLAAQYDRNITGMTRDAHRSLLAYDWPGNVRELQNRVMRAVVLADSGEIGPRELELPDLSGNGGGPEERLPGMSTDPVQPPSVSAWTGLMDDLSRQLDKIIAGNTPHPPPVGKWLAEDIILEASRITREITSRAANLVGIPESTYRRKLGQAKARAASGSSVRSPEWGSVRRQVSSVLDAGNPACDNLLELGREAILRKLTASIQGDFRTGAALMGVTETTYKKWSAEFLESGSEPAG